MPILTTLVAGSAAHAAETMSQEELTAAALAALRSVHGDKVTEPVASVASRWGSEPYTRGSYSFVAVGASSNDYDQLALPVARRVLFAGEHTCKEHPDTVGGAMLTGE